MAPRRGVAFLVSLLASATASSSWLIDWRGKSAAETAPAKGSTELVAFLAALNLEEHVATLVSTGYDSPKYFAAMSSADVDVMMAHLQQAGLAPGHALRICAAVRTLASAARQEAEPATPHTEWLHSRVAALERQVAQLSAGIASRSTATDNTPRVVAQRRSLHGEPSHPDVSLRLAAVEGHEANLTSTGKGELEIRAAHVLSLHAPDSTRIATPELTADGDVTVGGVLKIGTQSIGMVNAAGEIVLGDLASGDGSAPLVLRGNDQPVAWIKYDNGGRVGLGTDAPGAPLHVHRDRSDGPMGAQAQLRLSSTNSNTGIELMTAAGKKSWLIGAQYNVDGSFEITPSASAVAADGTGGHDFRSDEGATPALTVAESGNVGIGTSTPASKLDVAGDVRGREL